MLRHIVLGLLFVVIAGSQPVQVLAQGLIWNAPDEGTEIRFEGDYIQEDTRPNEIDPLQLKWRRHLTLKALKKTDADFKGKPVPCQWFEIKVVTASEVGGDGTLVPDPGGKRIYKVLVPLDRANIGPPASENVVDKENIPIAYLPIIKGYRRIDEQAEQPITSGVLDTYPMLTLMANYRTLDVIAPEEDPQVKLNSESEAENKEAKEAAIRTSTHFHGELTKESQVDRSTNIAEIWANNAIPFGLARWKVKLTREEKDSKAARDKFELASTITVDMKLVSWKSGAMSDLTSE